MLQYVTNFITICSKFATTYRNKIYYDLDNFQYIVTIPIVTNWSQTVIKFVTKFCYDMENANMNQTKTLLTQTRTKSEKSKHSRTIHEKTLYNTNHDCWIRANPPPMLGSSDLTIISALNATPMPLPPPPPCCQSPLTTSRNRCTRSRSGKSPWTPRGCDGLPHRRVEKRAF